MVISIHIGSFWPYDWCRFVFMSKNISWVSFGQSLSIFEMLFYTNCRFRWASSFIHHGIINVSNFHLHFAKPFLENKIFCSRLPDRFIVNDTDTWVILDQSLIMGYHFKAFHIPWWLIQFLFSLPLTALSFFGHFYHLLNKFIAFSKCTRCWYFEIKILCKIT